MTITFEENLKVNTQQNSAVNEEIEFEPYTVLPAGMYRCRLEAISNLETQFGPSLRFQWNVVSGDEEGEEVSGLVNKKLLPKSKLAAWAKAHLNISDFPEGFVLKLSSLINKEVMLTLGVEPRTDGGGDRNVIRAVDPIRAQARKAPKAPKGDGAFSDMLSGQGIPDPGEPMSRGERQVED
jgi:hypothetical protein